MTRCSSSGGSPPICLGGPRRSSRPATAVHGSRRQGAPWNFALDVSADGQAGTVDWRLTFPDGGVGLAQSRVTRTTRGTCIYTFVLHAPPVALEQVEGALEAQSAHLTFRTGDAEIVDGRSMTQPVALEDLARQALDGDRNAVEQLVRDLQGDVYGLALRMLWNREDAEDATQEILVSRRDSPGAVRLSQHAQDVGLPDRRQLCPRREEERG